MHGARGRGNASVHLMETSDDGCRRLVEKAAKHDGWTHATPDSTSTSTAHRGGLACEATTTAVQTLVLTMASCFARLIASSTADPHAALLERAAMTRSVVYRRRRRSCLALFHQTSVSSLPTHSSFVRLGSETCHSFFHHPTFSLSFTEAKLPLCLNPTFASSPAIPNHYHNEVLHYRCRRCRLCLFRCGSRLYQNPKSPHAWRWSQGRLR